MIVRINHFFNGYLIYCRNPEHFQVIAGFPTRFTLIAQKITQLREISKREFPKLHKIAQKSVKDVSFHLLTRKFNIH